VSTITFQEELKVVTPLRSLVGVMIMLQDLTTGSVPTHGTQVGVNKVSSELSKEIAVLMKPPMDVLQILKLLNSHSDLITLDT